MVFSKNVRNFASEINKHMRSLNENQKLKIQEAFRDYRCLLPRYLEVKNDPKLLRKFFTRNRNPLWDITSAKFFDTGLMSNEAKCGDEKLTNDHYIQRSLAVKMIFDEIANDYNMSLDKFTDMIKRYCSTLKITRKEYRRLINLAKQSPGVYNYNLYTKAGIKIPGLKKYIKNTL